MMINGKTSTPDNNELHVMLVKLDGKLDGLHDKMDASQKWQEKHEREDKEGFALLHKRISTGKLLLAPFGAVMGLIGYVWSK